MRQASSPIASLIYCLALRADGKSDSTEAIPLPEEFDGGSLPQHVSATWRVRRLDLRRRIKRMDDLVAIVVPIVVIATLAFALVAITKIISDGRTRRRLIEAGATPELAAAVAAVPQQDPGLYEALRWGLVIGAVGLSLILVQFLPYRADEPIVYGLVLLFGAAGLLLYYAVAKRLARR